jgi:hypothetical protein
VDIPLDIVLRVGGIIITGGVVVVGIKYAINGMREDIGEIKVSVGKLLVSDSEQSAEIAAIKATASLQQSWIERLEKWITDGLKDRRSDSR